MDTIFALASAPGKAGVSIIRISGPKAGAAAQRLGWTPSAPRKAVRVNLQDGQGAHLDDALVLFFPEGASFTGEEVIELHLHGSTAIIAATLAELSKIPELRMAEAGEFTRRALENGQMDLIQVEALSDLIDAETEAQRKQALRVLSGDLGTLVADWRSKLVRAAALIEACIDFADEEVPVNVTPEVRDLLTSVSDDIKSELSASKMTERVRTGFEVAILGAPNLGKSTLLNRLAGREAAITSEFAGTTRDVIEVRMDMAGLPVTLVDTAGLRETEDAVEAIGISRALERAEQADLRVILLDPTETSKIDIKETDIVRVSKSDLFDGLGNAISAKTGAGIDDLIDDITARLADLSPNTGLAIRERHRAALVDAQTSLALVFQSLDLGDSHYDLVAEELRALVHTLDILVGRVDVENLLDVIFKSFCIGK